MKSVFNFLKSSRSENDLLRKENKLLREAVFPLTSLGIPIENLAELLRPIANILKSEIEKKRYEASYNDSGRSSSSPASSPKTNFRW
jgi:hypothetical protein